MVANVLPAESPHYTRGWGQKSTFLELGHVAYQIYWNHMKQHGSNYLHADSHPLTIGVKKDRNSTFSEQCHVAYLIKGNYECSNMVANILPADPPPLPRHWGWGQWVTRQLFHNIFKMRITLKGITKYCCRFWLKLHRLVNYLLN